MCIVGYHFSFYFFQLKSLVLFVFFLHDSTNFCLLDPFSVCFFFYLCPERTSVGILKSHRPSVCPSVTICVSAITQKSIKGILSYSKGQIEIHVSVAGWLVVWGLTVL